MLSNHNQSQQQPSSPFLMEGLGASNNQPHQPTATPIERSKGRQYRRSGNACEVAAGASLNSAIVFLFHLLQVHPLGLVVALGVSWFYFAATAAGEGRDRFVSNAMLGCSAAIAGGFALSEPIGEWQQAKQSKAEATEILSRWYPSQGLQIDAGTSIALILLVAGVTAIGLKMISRSGKKKHYRGYYR